MKILFSTHRRVTDSHLTRLADPQREHRSSGCRSPVALAGSAREAAKLGGGTGETAGVTAVMGTDWLISPFGS